MKYLLARHIPVTGAGFNVHMRCDLHVHTNRSGMCTIPLLNRVCSESYNDPRAVYETLKRRGMHLVTITDHDSIGAAEELRGRPDFFLSEELSCVTPAGSNIHVGVYGISERQHVELQRRRGDLYALAAYLCERRILFSVNHAFSCLTGRRAAEDWKLFEELFPAFEVRNGAMLSAANNAAAKLAARLGGIALGGSDAHTLAGLGGTFTEVRGARNSREFLDGLRSGAGIVRGANGSFAKLTAVAWDIGFSLMRERPAARLLAPLMLAVPLITSVNYARELLFQWTWSRRLSRLDQAARTPFPRRIYGVPAHRVL